MKLINPTADIFMSVGDGPTNLFSQAANDSAFATNVIAVLNQYQLNGLDVDWEQRLNKTDLNALIMHLSNALHQQRMKLTLAVWQWVMPAYDMAVLGEYLDQINIMSYGTGIHLDECTRQFAAAGFPINKIIGGIEVERDYNQFGGVTDTVGLDGTIAEKTDYAVKNGLAGMMIWRTDNDYTTIVDPNYPTFKGAVWLWTHLKNQK